MRLLAFLSMTVVAMGCSSGGDATPSECVTARGTYAVGDRYFDGCNWCECQVVSGKAVMECTALDCLDASADTSSDAKSDAPTDSASDATTDAPADATTETASDTATDAALCDDKTCGAGQVCVVPCCAAPCKPARPFCTDIPTTCGGTPSCACMASACTGGASCGGMIAGRLQCACF